MRQTRGVSLDLNRRVRAALTELAQMKIKPTDEIGWIARVFSCERPSAERLIRNARK